MWAVLGSLIGLSLYAGGAYCSLRAAQTARTPQGAVGWVVFLLTAPFFALPAYLFLGQHRYKGYQIARRESAQVRRGIQEYSARNAPAPESTDVDLDPFEYCANLPAFRGNGMRLLIDGADTFRAIFNAIDRAESYVLVQFYIVRDDQLGREMKQHLIAAAQRGVAIRFMTDAIGSKDLPDGYAAELRAAGVRVIDRHSASGPRFRFHLNFRNHRKTVVVDGVTAFTGGMNVGDEYMGRDPRFGAWRDTHVQLSGPMVSQLQLIFVEDWHWMCDETLFEQLNWDAPHAPEDATGLIVATGPGDVSETGGLMFFSAIAAARHRLWIASPYFVPDLDIVTALRHAALRGVDVRVLVPHKADHLITWLAAFAYFDDIRESGVRIFMYREGFMHQKAFVVDDEIAAVGTTNMDNRSFRLNFETMALFFDAGATGRVETMLRADFDRSTELDRTLDQQPRYVRYGAPLARLFAPLL
ncbi:cardiolipin synthase [Rhodobacteraceae bacterium F11138]|nr:cardiolipin synthase [Rhodobacteraceae bacterium F11138]